MRYPWLSFGICWVCCSRLASLLLPRTHFILFLSYSFSSLFFTLYFVLFSLWTCVKLGSFSFDGECLSNFISHWSELTHSLFANWFQYCVDHTHTHTKRSADDICCLQYFWFGKSKMLQTYLNVYANLYIYIYIAL